MTPDKFRDAEAAVSLVRLQLWPLLDAERRQSLTEALVMLSELRHAALFLAVPGPISESERRQVLDRIASLFIVPQEITQ